MGVKGGGGVGGGRGGWWVGGWECGKGTALTIHHNIRCLAASPLKKHVCVFILNKIAHLLEQEFQLMHTVTELETS